MHSSKYKITLLIILLLFFSGCKKEISDEKIFLSIIDDTGDTVRFVNSPSRIISLGPNITETIYVLGADSILAGVTEYCNYPPEATQKQKVGRMLDPSLEIIHSIKPDLILMTTEGNSKTTHQALRNFNYKIFVTNPNSIDDIIRMNTSIGILTGKNENAEKLNSEIIKFRDSVLNLHSGKQRKKALVLISVNPMITANKRTFINDIINLSGLENIFAEEPVEYPSVNIESILIREPDYIIIPTDTNNTKVTGMLTSEVRSLMKNLNAVKENRIILIDENIISRPSYRVREASTYLMLNVK
ncbi:MAG: hypothetical protein FJ216_10510 [Ignavibacteria bacterium]|nr:hypothetical protein [Ignavibacteria bacterium]